MSALVGSFNMNIDKVLTFTPFFNGGSRLSLEIGIYIACRSLYIRGVHARAYADSL